jgi:hypothetical protein
MAGTKCRSAFAVVPSKPPCAVEVDFLIHKKLRRTFPFRFLHHPFGPMTSLPKMLTAPYHCGRKSTTTSLSMASSMAFAGISLCALGILYGQFCRIDSYKAI